MILFLYVLRLEKQTCEHWDEQRDATAANARLRSP